MITQWKRAHLLSHCQVAQVKSLWSCTSGEVGLESCILDGHWQRLVLEQSSSLFPYFLLFLASLLSRNTECKFTTFQNQTKQPKSRYQTDEETDEGIIIGNT